MKNKFLSDREVAYLNDPKTFIKNHGKNYSYSIKSRIIKKYYKMKKTMQYIELHVDGKTLQKLLHPRENFK